MENQRNRISVKFSNDKKETKKLILKTNFISCRIFNDYTLIRRKDKTVYLNKPVYLGACILELSKLLIYEFYYNFINKYWHLNELIYTDTDSFIVNINTYDVYEDMKSIKHLFDFSDYPKDHMLYSDKNNKVIGISKDDQKGTIIKEIIALKSKSYFINVHEDEIIKRLKGVTKATIKNQVTFEDAKECLENGKKIYHKNYTIRAENFELNTIEQNKISMSSFDNKRYLVNNIETIPYCDEEIKNNILNEKFINTHLNEMIDNIL